MLLHAENTVIPLQIIVYTPKGTNKKIALPFGTSLYDLRQQQMPPQADLTERAGLKLVSPEAALVKVPENCFVRNLVNVHVVLFRIPDASTGRGYIC